MIPQASDFSAENLKQECSSPMERFFHPTGLSQPAFSLIESESHHVARVLRKEVGEQIEVFDGQGLSAVAEIVSVTKSRVDVRLLRHHSIQKTTLPRLTLAAASPKGDRLKWLIEKVTELGIDQYIPLLSTRTVVEPGAGKIDKLQAAVIAACKQSGQNFVMQITENRSFTELLDHHQEMANKRPPVHVASTTIQSSPTIRSQQFVMLMGDPHGEWFQPEMIPPGTTDVLLLIGPEGGWTDDELGLAKQAGVRRVCCSDQILRTETAAIQLSGLCAWSRKSPLGNLTAQCGH